MTTFEKLDLIADSVNPILITLAVILTIKKEGDKGFKDGLRNFCYLLSGIIFVYLILGIDYQLNLWSRVNLDYSTHAAFALATILYLIKIGDRLLMWLSILLLYFLLILYQGYHSIWDITSTAVVLGFVLFFVYRILDSLFKK